MPDATPPVNRNRRSLSRSSYTPRFWTSSELRFDTSTVVPLRSSSCLLPDLVDSRPFPSAFTTLPFEQSRRRWFGTCSCKPIPRGRPSSIEQLRTSSAFRLFAVLVAHYNRVTVFCLGPLKQLLASFFLGVVRIFDFDPITRWLFCSAIL